MTFSKSNLNVLPESLFTELTADQAQMLEGGKRIDILNVKCIKPGDSDGTDELLFIVGGQLFNDKNPFSMRANSVVQPGISKTFNSSTKVGLFDSNGSAGTQLIGSFKASAPTNGTQVVRVNNLSSIYDVTIRVTD
jgi:hypothetical protein